MPAKWRLARPIASRTRTVDVEHVKSLLTALNTNQFHLEAELEKQAVAHFAVNRERFSNADLQGYLLALLPPLTVSADGDSVEFPEDWSECLDYLCNAQPSYGAHQNNRLYHSWQNTSSADAYEQRFGAIPSGLRQGIPNQNGVIEQKEGFLNTNLNPGRRILDPGFRFRTVAADLWLGPHFWDYAPCTKEEVLAADFFLEKRDTPHFLYLKSWPHPFTRPDGEQGRVQQKLWRLLFKEDCEWPPGSGGISDEPVGGPPELMP